MDALLRLVRAGLSLPGDPLGFLFGGAQTLVARLLEASAAITQPLVTEQRPGELQIHSHDLLTKPTRNLSNDAHTQHHDLLVGQR
jgi:hypothetical protein